jgi:hypothetical protein
VSELIGTVQAFDCLSDVHVSYRIIDYDSLTSGHELIAAGVVQLRGEGISDPRAWLRDALVGLLETL